MTNPREAYSRLLAGNQRFRAGSTAPVYFQPEIHARMASPRPHTVVLGCADSRVPVEAVFDQAIGDLFVVRVAGNLVQTSQIASVEFAVDHFGPELVVVLGHSGCGAVRATLDYLRSGTKMPSVHLDEVVQSLRPAVEGVLEAAIDGVDADSVEQQAVRANVVHGVGELVARSSLLAKRIEQGRLAIIGAEYDLATGRVEFFADVPSSWVATSDGSSGDS